MKRILFIFLFILSLLQPAGAQIAIGNIISAGYGFPSLSNYYFDNYINYNNYNSTSIGPIYLKFEHEMTPRISLGVSMAFADDKAEYFIEHYQYNIPNTQIVSYHSESERISYSVLLRFNWNIIRIEQLESYFGFGMGYKYVKWTQNSEDPNQPNDIRRENIPIGFESTIGVRYFFSKNIAAYTEVGFAKSPIQFGICLKLIRSENKI